MNKKTCALGKMEVGMRGLVLRISEENLPLSQRLRELGMIEGGIVEISRKAPFGGDPIAVRVRGGLIALRREEANLIEVDLEFDGHE